MNKKLVLAAPCLIMLAACGGGSTGNNSYANLADASTIYRTINSSAGGSFQNTPVAGDGLGTAVASDGTKSIIYNDEISALVQLANDNSSDFLSIGSRAQFSSSSNNGNYKTSVGVSTVNGTEVALTLIEDLNHSGTSISFIDMPDGESDIEFVSGANFTSPSIYHSSNGTMTSTYTLTGIQALSPTQASDPSARGNFVFTVEFINGYWTYTGSSGAYSLSASGTMGANGQFFDGDAIVSISPNPYSYAEVAGNLHGNATSVSGAFFTTDVSNPVVNGSFIGSR